MKKIFVFLALALLLAVNAFAGYVFDNEDLLTDYEEELIEEKLSKVSLEASASVVVVTAPSLGSKSSKQYADDFYDNGNFSSDGILLLVSLNTRDWAVSTTGRAIEAFEGYPLDIFEEEIVPYLSDGEFYEAFYAFADFSARYLDRDYKEPLSPLRIFVPIIVGLITGIITVSIMTSKLKSVRAKTTAAEYVKSGSFNLTHSYDHFLWRNVRRTQKSSSSSSGSGSRSGSSHGGRSGKF